MQDLWIRVLTSQTIDARTNKVSKDKHTRGVIYPRRICSRDAILTLKAVPLRTFQGQINIWEVIYPRRIYSGIYPTRINSGIYPGRIYSEIYTQCMYSRIYPGCIYLKDPIPHLEDGDHEVAAQQEGGGAVRNAPHQAAALQRLTAARIDGRGPQVLARVPPIAPAPVSQFLRPRGTLLSPPPREM